MSSKTKNKSGRSFKPTFREMVESTRQDAAEQTWARANAVSAMRHAMQKSGKRRQAKALAAMKVRLIKRTIELVPDQVKIAVDHDYMVGLLSIRWKGHGKLHLPATTQLPENRIPTQQFALSA